MVGDQGYNRYKYKKKKRKKVFMSLIIQKKIVWTVAQR